MATIRGSITIRRSIDEVFDFVADERNEPSYNPQMQKVEQATTGPVGAGTVWHATVASGKRVTPVAVEITDYARPSRLGSVTRLSTADINGGLTFAPAPQGTLLSWSWELRPKGMLKFITPLFAAIGRRQERRIWSSLKRQMEATPRPL